MHLVQIPFRWAALRGRYYVHLVQMHGPFPNSVRVGVPLFGGLSHYQDYICALLKFADPTPDKQRANEDEAVTNAAEQELHAQRYAIQAYLHRTHQPLELGV